MYALDTCDFKPGCLWWKNCNSQWEQADRPTNQMCRTFTVTNMAANINKKKTLPRRKGSGRTVNWCVWRIIIRDVQMPIPMPSTDPIPVCIYSTSHHRTQIFHFISITSVFFSVDVPVCSTLNVDGDTASTRCSGQLGTSSRLREVTLSAWSSFSLHEMCSLSVSYSSRFGPVTWLQILK